MSLPTPVKTWQFQINQTVAAQGSVAATEKRLVRTIKDLLKGFGTNPWTVQMSSNGITSSAADNWASDADIVKAAGGSAHSWIVLRQTSIAANFEVCIDMNTTTQSQASVIVSPSAGFTGGSLTARPTATDEIVLINATTWMSGVDTQHQIHVMQSTDGQCTRVMVFRGGTNLCTFFLFDKPKDPPTGWTNPSVSIALAASALYANSYSLLTGTPGRGRGAATFNIALTGEGNSTAVSGGSGGVLASDTANGLGSSANDFDATWPFYPIGICSTTVSHRGRHGTLFDLWWRPNGVNDADTFPNNASARQFVALGNLIFPWDGGATIPLLT